MAKGHPFRASRYSAYSGGPDPLAPPVDLAEALEEIGRDVMEGTSPRRALQELLRRGTKNLTGADQLAAEAQRRRRELLRRNNLDGTLAEVKKLLDEAVLAERKELARALDDDARFGEMQLEALSPSPAKAVQELADYDWRSTEARESYEKIKDLLGREMLDQRFAGMKQALEGATDADRQRVSEMLDDLNDLLDKHSQGTDSAEDFQQFMDKHREFFPENPSNVEELLDSLAQRAAAAQRFRNSLSAEQRAELDALAEQAFGSPSLQQALGRLDAHLQAARPGEDWTGSSEFSGENPLGMGEGAQALADIAELEQLAEQLSQAYPGASMDDVDLDALARQLGDQAAVDARTLAELERALLNQGFLDRSSDGQWRLSPKAMRRLGETALRDVARQLSGRRGERDHRRAGAAGELTGATRPWQFGDTEPWNVTRTLTNSVLRQVAGGSARLDEGEAKLGPPGRRSGSARLDEGEAKLAGARGRLSISVDDVEVSETETRTQSAVALLVDTSFSMVMDNRWLPMKRTALALNHLVSTRFRSDALQIIAFGRYARTVTAAELTGLEGVYEQGTNLHHALALASRHLRRHPNAQPVVLVVTDGEPTAHLEDYRGDGSAGPAVFFDYPPHPRTIAHTVRGFDEVARLGAQVTIFRLGDDPGLARFIDQVARRVQGRVVVPELDGLGAAVVGDYLRARRR
ncbi:vWA domain-containing protein [Mycolicibacter arupensis]|uniref:vWA domain-containing protein n=1 Tax=Mycolicibacter arupensis TaxID=342002 RepID=UPI00122CF272|nr:VWA domain-containing protein [Mycolicibacter arupensis]KAA1431875.1 VWA domain-containing protein [Mycolicibacter arupensis]